MRETRRPITIRLAGRVDRDAIFRIRHRVYAEELGQHRMNPEERLSDPLDDFNVYIVAEIDDTLAGFVSITPPGGPSYSIDKYLTRAELPFPFDGRLFEVRLLTVAAPYRGTGAALLLMYAALRWVEAHGGKRIVAIGRREVMGLYREAGLVPLGRSFRSGAVTYEAMSAATDELRALIEGNARLSALLRRLERSVDWKLDVRFRKPTPCHHGGAFFDAIGDEFASLDRRAEIINADVLDAWFPPSPRALASLAKNLDWIVRTSPPTDCGGLVRTIARVRGVPPECVLPGGGSSELIFLAFREWLGSGSRTLVLDPSYGEYAHVLEHVVGCRVERIELCRRDGYSLDVDLLCERVREGFDLVVLVNPNSPTGRHARREDLEAALREVPPGCRIWVDETYVEYAGEEQSLEPFAASSESVFVCKSLSKAYALSGVRVAYLCGPAHRLEQLRALTPPWAVGLPGQIAAVEALGDAPYYRSRYEETHRLRVELADRLRAEAGLDVVPGVANFLLCHLPESGPESAAVVERCRQRGLFLRDASKLSPALGRSALRIAVKDLATNGRILSILRAALSELVEGSSTTADAGKAGA